MSEPVDERAALRAELATRAAPSLRPASLVSADPLRPLPGALLAKLEVRARAGYDPAGPDHPRRERAQQIVLVPLLITVVLAVLMIIGFATGHDGLAIAAAVLAGADLVLAGSAWRWIQADPLRVQPAERHALTAAGYWQSSQPWTGALAAGSERALVGVAVETVATISSNPAWRSGYLDGHRLVFDLAAELDAVDAQAFEVARARAGGGAEADVQASFDSALDRVVALRRYAGGLAELTSQIATTGAQLHAAPAIGALRGDRDQSQYAVDGIARLTDELGVISASVEATAAEVRKERE
jgi:hypothetical protein